MRAGFDAAAARWDGPVTEWVVGLELALCGHDTSLDGRRLGMLRRNALCAFVLRPDDDPGEILRDVLHASLPYPATAATVDDARLASAHRQAFHRAFGERAPARPATLLLAIRDPDVLVARYVACAADLDEAEHELILARVFDVPEGASPEDKLEGALCGLPIVRAVTRHPADWPPLAVSRVFGWFQLRFGVYLHEPGPPVVVTPDGDDPVEALARRLIWRAGCDPKVHLDRVRTKLRPMFPDERTSP